METFSQTTFTQKTAEDQLFAIPFDFISRSHINVLMRIEEGPEEDYTGAIDFIDDNQIRLPDLPLDSFASIRRETPKEVPVTFLSGNPILARDLNLSFQTAFFIFQEICDDLGNMPEIVIDTGTGDDDDDDDDVVPPPPPVQLLVNPNFETGDFTGWTTDSSAWVVTDQPTSDLPGASSGSFYAVRPGGGGGTFTLEQQVPVAENAPYSLSFDHAQPFGDRSQYELIFQDINLVTTGTTGIVPLSSLEDDWRTETLEGFAPPNTTQATIRLAIRNSDGASTTGAFDNITLNVGGDLIPRIRTSIGTNLQAQTGDLTGWDVIQGEVNVNTDGDGTGGNFFASNSFEGGAAETIVMVQNIDVSAFATEIDTGLATASLVARLESNFSDADTGTFRLRFLSTTGTELLSVQTPDLNPIGTGIDNTDAGDLNIAIPSGTRSVEIGLLGSRDQGTILSVLWHIGDLYIEA